MFNILRTGNIGLNGDTTGSDFPDSRTSFLGRIRPCVVMHSDLHSLTGKGHGYCAAYTSARPGNKRDCCRLFIHYILLTSQE